MTTTSSSNGNGTASNSPLTIDKAESLVRLMTDGLVNIVDETGQFLMPLADGTIIDTKGWKGWEWTHGIALTALINHSECSPSSSSADHSLQTALEWFETQYKLSKGAGAPKNINTMSPFYMLSRALLDGKVKDERWTKWCDEWAEWVMNDLPRTEEGGFQHITYLEVNKNQLWDDTLMMTVIPLAQIGILLNRPHYIEEAKYQFLLHIQYLMDPVTGLWYHGWEFTPTPGSSTSENPAHEGQPGHNFANALWARGNCWITVAIPLFLAILGEEYLPSTDPIRKLLVSTLKRQADALVKTQNKENGLWHTLLVDPTSYVETSATAGFAAGIFAAVRMKLLPESYLPTATSALAGVISQIAPDGEVNQVSFGTGMGRNFQFYHDIPITSMPYGQALAMLAIVEWERLELASKSS